MRATPQIKLVALILLIGIASRVVAAAQEPNDSSPPALAPEVSAIVSGWRANRDRIPFLYTESVRVQAFAASFDDAIAGKYLETPEPVRCEHRSISDGITSRFDEIFPPKLADVPRSQHVNQIEIRNSQVELLSFPKTKQNMLARVGKRTREPRTPFFQGAWMCSRAAERKISEYLGERELDGRALKGLSISAQDGSERYVFWVDPDRGFIPVRTEFRRPPEAEPHEVIIVQEFLELTDNRWAPKRWVSISVLEKPDRPFYATEETVIDFDFDTPPAPELFDLDVSPGEDASYEVTQTQQGPVESIRFLDGKIRLSWFDADGSIHAPEGAIERIPPYSAATQLTVDAIRRPLTALQMTIVLVVSVSVGFGCLALFRLLRRRTVIAVRSENPSIPHPSLARGEGGRRPGEG